METNYKNLCKYVTFLLQEQISFIHTINESNPFWLNSQEATNKQSQVSLDPTFAAKPLYKSRFLFAKVEKNST
jgi:hypothetical protein